MPEEHAPTIPLWYHTAEWSRGDSGALGTGSSCEPLLRAQGKGDTVIPTPGVGTEGSGGTGAPSS